MRARLTKEQTGQFYEILEAYEKKDMEELEKALAEGKEVLSLFGGFDARIIFNLEDVFSIIENLIKEKGKSLNIDPEKVDGDQDLKAFLRVVSEKRLKDINLSPVFH